MDSSRERYDGALMGILQNEGSLEKFLDAIMAFMYRRTDFFMLMKSKDSKLGFPPGVAAKFLIAAYERYELMARNRDKQAELQAAPAAEQNQTSSVSAHIGCDPHGAITSGATVEQDVPPVVDEVEVVSDSPSASMAATVASKAKADSSAVASSNDQAIFQANPESHNGAIRDTYSWSQTIMDVDIRVKVPAYVKKGKDVIVVFTRRHLSVSYKDLSSGDTVAVVNDDLPWEINKEESTWTLIPGDHVHVNFAKVQERWWDCAFVNEQKIDTKKIEAVRPLSDLDDEAQAKIEELMYNDRRKKLGLPSSQEEKMQELLKKAWDKEGSPFKGQPFDPSVISMSPGDNSCANIGPLTS